MVKHNKYVVGLLALSISTSFLSNTTALADELKNGRSIINSTDFYKNNGIIKEDGIKEKSSLVYEVAPRGLNGKWVVNDIEWEWEGLEDGTVAVKPCDIEAIGNEVVIPSIIKGYKVTAISESAFELCEKLQTITISENVTIIGGSAFSGCKSLTNVVLPQSIEVIEPFAFSSSGIKNIIIPDQVREIKDDTFWDCQSLENVILSNGIVSIGEESFSRCSSLKTIIIPNSVKDISENAFSYSGLKDVVILNGLKEIKDCTFKGCVNLDTITVPDSVTKIGEEAFIGCISNIKTVYCNEKSYAEKYFKLD